MSNTVKITLSVTDMYQYTALGSENSDIRLLTLLKGSGPQIECKLSPESLHDVHPPYEALSYTWGSSELVECMTLDQKPFWITDNLYAALQSLRLHDRDRILWIDAICINQEDKLEQSHQVQQMGRIYERAEKVLIWLGKATPQIIALMEALNQLRDIDTGSYDEQAMLKNQFGKDYSKAMKQILNREWFTRVWIIQEVAKAHRADVCCGVRAIPAETFVRALSLMKHEPPPHCKPVLDIMAKSSQSDSWWTQTHDLRTLLRKFQGSKATDERDKIYALLGISSDSLDTKNVVIDYRRPTSQVAHEVMTYLLQSPQTNQLDPFTIHDVLDIMCSFTTLDVTFFLLAKQYTPWAIYTKELEQEITDDELERKISEPHQTKFILPGIGVFNGPIMLLFEERPTEDLDNQKSCYSQVFELMLDQQSSRTQRDYDKGMHVFPWGNLGHHVKVVVIHDMEQAMVKAAVKECDQVFRQLLYARVGIAEEEGCEACALQEAAKRGPTGLLQSMLDAGADINAQSEKYGTALQAAASSGKKKVVVTLLDAGADINAQSEKYGTALQAAASSGKKEVVVTLLNAGADVNAQGGEYGNLLQAVAAGYGDEEIVKILLEAGADVNAQGGKYGTALQAAARYNNKETVKMLLNAGADINARGGECETALQAAARYGNEEVVKMLLDAGVDVNAQGGEYGNLLQAVAAGYGDEEIVKILLEAGADVNAQGGKYGTALQAAARYGNEEVVKMLLEAGADVNAQGGEYGTVLQAAAVMCGSKEIVKILLEAGADVNAQGGIYGTALQAAAAAKSRNGEVVKMLLEAGADVNAQGGEYGTALQAAAASYSDEEVVKMLFNAGADVNAQGGEYGTALQAAAWYSSKETVKMLLKAGADVNAQGGEYGTALQAAAATEYDGKGKVKMLLKAGAHVNVQGGIYGTALQAAAAAEYDGKGKVKMLLKAEAHVNVQGGIYGTALQAAAAAKSRNGEVVKMLLEAGADVNAQGGRYGTALGAAESRGRGEEIVQMLLDAGAKRDSGYINRGWISALDLR